MKSLCKIVIASITAFVASGCAPTTIIWDKAGSTQEQFAKDNYTCMQQSQQQYASYVGQTSPYVPAMGTARSRMNQSLYIACMQAQGYTARPPQ